MFNLSDMEISTRTRNLLRANNINTLPLFLALTKEDILGWTGAGHKTYREIADEHEHLQSRRPSRITQICELVTELNMLLPAHQIALQLTPDGKLAVYERKA
jgi:DNA-directed RNA polymerase alpha subunit